jgi:hypothetical protein
MTMHASWSENDQTIIVKKMDGKTPVMAMTLEQGRELLEQLSVAIKAASEMEPRVFGGGPTLVSNDPNVPVDDVIAQGAERMNE